MAGKGLVRTCLWLTGAGLVFTNMHTYMHTPVSGILSETCQAAML